MSRAFAKFFHELQRRKVIHTFIAYLAVAWVVLQVVALISGALKLPDWTLKLVLMLALLGLPAVLVMAWVFDLSRRGMVRTAGHSFDNDKAWLAAVLHLRLQPVADDGSLKPRKRLQQAIEMSGCLWHRWNDLEASVVFASAEQAISVMVALQSLAQELHYAVRAGIAIGSVQVNAHNQLQGEAQLIAAALSAASAQDTISGTEQVHDELRQRSEFGGRYLQALPVAELAHPVRMYELHWQLLDDDVLATPVSRPWRWVIGAIALVAVVALGIVFVPHQKPNNNVSPINNAITFVALETSSKQLSLPDYFRYGLNLALHQGIAKLPGYYLADERTRDSSRFRINVDFIGNDEHRLVANVSIVDQLANQTLANYPVNKAQSELYFFIDDINQTAVQTLAKYTQQNIPSFAPRLAIDENAYALFLRAHSIISQSDGGDDWPQSEHLVQQALQSAPKFAPLLTLRCDIAMMYYKYRHQIEAIDRANADCLSAADLAEPDADLWRAIGEMWWLKGDSEKAEQALQNAIAADPRASQAYSTLSKIYVKNGDLLQAERVLVQATMLQPGHWAPLRALAIFQFNNGRYKDAVTNYQRVVELLPNSAGAYNDLGAALFFTGKLQEAANSYRMSLQIATDQDALSNLASLYYYLGRMSDAIEIYQKAINITPDHFILHGNLADAYRQAGRVREANESYRLALQLLEQRETTRDDPQSLALSGHYYASLGDCDEGQRRITAAIAAAPGQVEIQFNAAIVAMQCQQTAEAIKSLTKAKQVGYPAHLMSVDPDLAPLSSQPEFLALVTQSK